MKLKSLFLCGVISVLVSAAACTKSSPARPSDIDGAGTSASVTDAASGITLTTATLITPTDNQQFKFTEQPVTLTFKNAVSTGKTALTYTVEVASDAAFAAKVYTKEGLAEATAQTAIKIDKLAGAKTYYWRVRASSGSLPGPYTKARAFVVGPEVVIQAPTLGDPVDKSTVSQLPTLNVNTVQRTGPAGPIFYRFEISETSSFSSLVQSATVKERTDLPYTSHAVTSKLAAKIYYWRVQASDPSNSITSPYSNIAQFTVQEGIDLHKAIYVMGPSIADWGETSTITDYDISNGILCIWHTMLGQWPKEVFPFGDAYIEGNQYVFGQIDGQWYGGSADWYRPGQACKNVDIGEVYVDSFQLNITPLSSYRPSSGDIVGIGSTTPSRFWPDPVGAMERTNMLLVKVP